MEDPDLKAQILNSLGVIYYHQRKMDKAETYFLRASDLQFTATNLLDVDSWQILNNLACIYQITRQYAKAEDVYKRSFQLAEVRRGPAHPGLIKHRARQSWIVVHRDGSLPGGGGSVSKKPCNARALKTSFDSMFMMRTLYGLGGTYLRENDAIRAEGPLARATEIARRCVLASEMPEVLEVLETYARVLKDLSHSVEAERLEMEAQRIRAAMAYTVPVTSAK